MSSVTSEGSVQLLGEVCSGPVLAPGDPGYDEARRVHNGLIDKHPAVIARCLHGRRRRRCQASAGAKESRSRFVAAVTASPARRSPRAG